MSKNENDPATSVDEDIELAAAPKEVEEQENQEKPEAKSRFIKHSHRAKLTSLKIWYLSHKKLSIPASAVVVLLLLGAIPFTRYAIAGTFLKQQYSIQVKDTSTSKPVTNATVSIAGVTAETDNEGKATLRVKVGNHRLKITKKYYKEVIESITVPLAKPKSSHSVSLTATGRQVPIVVRNKISGKAVQDISIKAAGTEFKTGEDGKVTLVVPANQKTITGTLSGAGYNDTNIMITVTDQSVAANNFQITPSGKIYFLSKLSGKIDVVKTNLDGTERKTVIAGTGLEEDQGTVMLASRDWKYLALLSRREGDKPKLHLIETATDTMSVMDKGDASFALSGWSDQTFVYTVTRHAVPFNEGKRLAIKSFNAESKKLTTIEQNAAQNVGGSNFYQSLEGIYLIDGRIVYNKSVYASYYYTYVQTDLPLSINSAKTDGTDKKVLKSFAAGSTAKGVWERNYISSKLENPKTVEYKVQLGSEAQNYEYENNAVKQVASYDDNDSYPTFLISPSSNATFWYEQRDGKNILFLGDKEADNSKTVQSHSEYITYGWYTDSYLLVSKGGSELFILPAEENIEQSQVLKITDYHKPNYSFYGYGGGYGGL